MHDAADAIAMLAAVGIPVRKRAYGFTISHPEMAGTNRSFASCSCEHDTSISMGVYVNETPPVVWFCRFDFTEMAILITESYRQLPKSASRADIVSQMRSLDALYDYDQLESRIEEWKKEFAIRFPNNSKLQ